MRKSGCGPDRRPSPPVTFIRSASPGKAFAGKRFLFLSQPLARFKSFLPNRSASVFRPRRKRFNPQGLPERSASFQKNPFQLAACLLGEALRSQPMDFRARPGEALPPRPADYFPRPKPLSTESTSLPEPQQGERFPPETAQASQAEALPSGLRAKRFELRNPSPAKRFGAGRGSASFSANGFPPPARRERFALES